MGNRPANDGLPWTREQLVLAFELYCRIPFQQTKANNPSVKELAVVLERTPASIARKLGNFGAFDPQLAAQQISGLTHGSKLDKLVWDQFHQDWTALVSEANAIRNVIAPHLLVDTAIELPEGASERQITAKQRLHQAFFRDAVLASYNERCCVTALPLRECLIASHIIPWSIDEARRSDPTNGLCLSATFERLFDRGLIAIALDFTLLVSNRLRRTTDQVVAEQIAARHGQVIALPTRFLPDADCLRWHRDHIFLAA